MPLAKLSAQSADGTAQIRDLRRATMETQQVELIDRILSDGNIEAAIHAVKSNRGAAGIDKMTVDALEGTLRCTERKSRNKSVPRSTSRSR